MNESFFAKAKKAFVGAIVAGLYVLGTGWMANHQLNLVDAVDAVVGAVVTWIAVYVPTNGAKVRRRPPLS